MTNFENVSAMADDDLVEAIRAFRLELSRRKPKLSARIKLTPEEMARVKRFKAKQSNNTSGCKGVTFNKGAAKWQAKIGCDGKIKHLGYFKTMQEAVSARESAEREMWGE
jgi:hypothetical protein